jgi:hypothetical protein
VKFVLRTAMKICRDNPDLVIIGHKYLARYMNTEVRVVVVVVVVARDI